MESYKPLYKKLEKLELRDVEPAQKSSTKIHCPSCAVEVKVNDIDLSTAMAKCEQCNRIFSIRNEIEKLNKVNEAEAPLNKPEGIEMYYYNDTLEISTRQHLLNGVDAWGTAILPIAAVLAGFISYSTDGRFPFFIPIIMILASLYFIFKATQYSKYRSYIELTKTQLSIKNRPQNFKVDRNYDAKEIDQIYIKYSAERYGFFVLYMIVNGIEGQKHEKMLTVSTASKAKFIEQEIEHYLSLKDRKVPEANVE